MFVLEIKPLPESPRRTAWGVTAHGVSTAHDYCDWLVLYRHSSCAGNSWRENAEAVGK